MFLFVYINVPNPVYFYFMIFKESIYKDLFKILINHIFIIIILIFLKHEKGKNRRRQLRI